MQHARLSCPSPTARACWNSGPSSWWCHPTISSSIFSFSSCLQYFPASRSFPMSQFFTSDGQSIGTSASASVLTMDIQGWLPVGWMVWSPCSPRDSQESTPAPQFESIFLVLSLLYGPTLTSIHDYWRNYNFYFKHFCWQNDLCFLINEKYINTPPQINIYVIPKFQAKVHLLGRELQWTH